jgi:hypothetical protein
MKKKFLFTMNIKHTKKTTYLLLTAAVAASGSALGGTIVPDLNDGDAVFSSTIPTTTGTNSYNPTNANGVTLAARFTPSALDITNSASGAVAIIETGGTTSGTGLWILDGSVWFSSSSGDQNAFPSSSSDLDGSDSAVGVQLGSVTAGSEMTVFVSFDTAGGSLLASQDSSISVFTLAGVADGWNWTGNDTVGFGIADPEVAAGGNLGWRGGLGDLDGLEPPSLFNGNTAMDLDGSVSLGQVFNDVSAVPEPSTVSLLAGLFGFAVLRRRRNS